mgnify:CR=1 FL=1
MGNCSGAQWGLAAAAGLGAGSIEPQNGLGGCAALTRMAETATMAGEARRGLESKGLETTFSKARKAKRGSQWLPRDQKVGASRRNGDGTDPPSGW